MLTTTLDGLWVLQVLSGIEVLAPELGLRPHLPSVESPQAALAHPAAEELRAAGVVDDSGAVDQTVLEWLTVLSRRDVALLIYAQTPSPAAGAEPERVLIARFAAWWVSVERFANQIRLCGAGTASSEQSAGQLIAAQIERVCGQMPPATLRPVTIEVDELLRAVRETGDLRGFLLGSGLGSDQVALLTLASDTERAAQASIVAIQSGVASGPAIGHIGAGTVTVIDTPRGRLVSEQVKRGERSWMIVGPGSAGSISSAVLTMMRNLPAREGWYSYRKAV